jgi:hypothetical protein
MRAYSNVCQFYCQIVLFMREILQPDLRTSLQIGGLARRGASTGLCMQRWLQSLRWYILAVGPEDLNAGPGDTSRDRLSQTGLGLAT